VRSNTIGYRFAAGVPADEVRDTLELAAIAAATLHGDARVRREAPHRFDPVRRRCEIDVGTPVGGDLSRLFHGLLTREFGGRAVEIDHAPQSPGASFAETEPSYRTFGDWVDELGLDGEQVDRIRKLDPALRADTPLTAERLDDLIGLAMRNCDPQGRRGL
jgi:hypothetical protein